VTPPDTTRAAASASGGRLGRRSATLQVRAATAPDGLRRRLDVIVALSQADLRLRYGRGRSRLLKWLLDPFAVAGVYLLLVTFVLDRTGPAPGLSIACAIVPFQIVMSSVVNTMSAVSSRRSIILNMTFDRTLIPVAGVLTETIAFAASLLLLVMMMALYGVAPTVSVAWLPLVLLVTVAFSVAVGYPCALFGLWFRELRQFFVSFVRTMFFLAPGLVALVEIEGLAADLIRLNPLTGLFESFRDVLLYGQRPAAWQLLYPLGFAVVVLAIYLPVFRRDARDFAKVVD
jgi:ABC-type polysaccharide/polyol phosphate export permease